MVRFAVRYELARSVEDVLARRSRWLFLDARRAADAAEPVAAILREELGERFDAAASVGEFTRLAEAYRIPPLP
jgi:glycerol-3-phosphate dehydrogenase